jgi:hypothetical protein
MEKVVYVLWRDAKVEQEDFARTLRTEIADQLVDAGVLGLHINVIDEACAPATGIYHVYTRPQMEAVLHVWVNSSSLYFRKPLDEIVAKGCERFAAYLVTESVTRPNTKHFPEPGKRSYGLAQIGFGYCPDNITREQFIDKMREYAPTAISAQSLFYHQQNVITRILTPGAPDWASMVEECFPEEAMTDPHVFFDAVGDPKKYQENVDKIMAGVTGFVDFEKIDVIPTSQYIIKKIQE